MSALAAPVRSLPRGGHESALRAATQLAAAAGSPEFLTLVAASACRAAGVARCAVYLSAGEGRFRGETAFPSSHADAVSRLTAGGPADLITREIVETHAPVLIRDTLTDPRAAQGALRAWKVRAILGVPLLHGDEVTGLLYLDPAGSPALFTRGGGRVGGRDRADRRRAAGCARGVRRGVRRA